jgi:hypothetical protein
MLADGIATAEDVARWGEALDRMDHSAVRPTVFVANFVAIGRKAQ